MSKTFLIKMSQTLSAIYYQENKERLQKSWQKISKFSKEEQEKSSNMVMNVTKYLRRWKTKACYVKKRIIENKKKCYMIIIRNICCKNKFKAINLN